MIKQRLIWLHVVFLLAVVGIIPLALVGSEQWILLALSGIAGVLAVAILYSWLKFISIVATDSRKLHDNNAQEYSTWTWSNLDSILKNHQQVEKKFHVSAELIANLAKDENPGTSSDLIASDPIGKALQAIRVEMKKLKVEENQRTWINQGLARFSDILRSKNEIKEYSYQIISNLVKYMGANQGGLYVEYHDDDRYMELTACYAYERRKYQESKILAGQGLLGQCMLEKDLIFITDVPKDYVKITSGLGQATPRCIVVVPLIDNEIFYGAIEMASFEVLKPHQLEFLKKVCENIASEIASIKNIENTQKLLNESHQLTQELQSREEEMRQNMEELSSTQEEMARKQAELTGILNAIDLTIATAEFDMMGTFRNANEIFLKVLGYRMEELHTKDSAFFMGEDHNTVMLWENLRLGKLFSGEFKMRDKFGKELWLTGTFNPITTNSQAATKIMMFAQFTTQEKEKLNELTGIVQVFKAALPIAEFSDNFICKTANEKFLKLFGLSRLNLKSKSILDFIDPYYHGAWKKKSSDVLGAESTLLKLPIRLDDHTATYEVNISVTHNLEGKVAKVILLLVREVNEVVPVLAVG